MTHHTLLAGLFFALSSSLATAQGAVFADSTMAVNVAGSSAGMAASTTLAQPVAVQNGTRLNSTRLLNDVSGKAAGNLDAMLAQDLDLAVDKEPTEDPLLVSNN